jgi:hypothetical protein
MHRPTCPASPCRAWRRRDPLSCSFYAVLIATGGPNSDSNPVGFREHINPAYQGLRHIPGRGPYPIQESFFARGFGTGTRHRGAAVVVQITTDLTYTPPTIET